MSRSFASLILCLLAISLQAEAWIRWNQQGYAPAAPKAVIVMSERDLVGLDWQLSSGERVVVEGTIGESFHDDGSNSPMPFHYTIDLSDVAVVGEYRLNVPDAAPATVRVWARPYADLASLPLQHLRMQRSGTDTVRWRRASHFGDAQARVQVPQGDPGDGAWGSVEPERTVDALGGWYDAGDCLKFTLTTAYTVYHLLLAYEVAPEIFGREHSTSDLPDLLDEAKHGLDYLVKMMPDEHTFVVQVGDALDHNQGWRLPADDKLDGQRPALVAMSRVHLNSAAAALALGARLLADHPELDSDVARYAASAKAMFARAQQADTIETAFERDVVNDFYRDNSAEDQACLAASELGLLTGKQTYFEFARTHRPEGIAYVSWANWGALAARRLAEQGDADAIAALSQARLGYEQHAREQGQPWGLPTGYSWGSMMRWISTANSAQLTATRVDAKAEQLPLFHDVLDYVFGRNPWGVSFLFDERLPNTLRNLYSPTASLLARFPTGALSEGPTRRSTHESMRAYFSVPDDDPFERFNTESMVFYDNATDFVCQEATISGQADVVLMLALAAALDR